MNTSSGYVGKRQNAQGCRGQLPEIGLWQVFQPMGRASASILGHMPQLWARHASCISVTNYTVQWHNESVDFSNIWQLTFACNCSCIFSLYKNISVEPSSTRFDCHVTPTVKSGRFSWTFCGMILLVCHLSNLGRGAKRSCRLTQSMRCGENISYMWHHSSGDKVIHFITTHSMPHVLFQNQLIARCAPMACFDCFDISVLNIIIVFSPIFMAELQRTEPNQQKHSSGATYIIHNYPW